MHSLLFAQLFAGFVSLEDLMTILKISALLFRNEFNPGLYNKLNIYILTLMKD